MLKVNKQKTTAYPFHPAMVSDDCARNDAAKQLFGDAGKMKVATAMGTIRYFKKSTQNPPCTIITTWGILVQTA